MEGEREAERLVCVRLASATFLMVRSVVERCWEANHFCEKKDDDKKR